MSVTATTKMTADSFIAWAMEQPDGARYELVEGEVFAMAPERLPHTKMKGEVFAHLREAVRRQNLPCQVLQDGVSIRVDDTAVFEPDVTVRCGPGLSDEAIFLHDPVILVEVISPSSRGRDTGVKFGYYFRLPSLRHYLIVNAVSRTIIHHLRHDDDTIATRIVGRAPLRLEPPGIELGDIFADLP